MKIRKLFATALAAAVFLGIAVPLVQAQREAEEAAARAAARGNPNP